MAIISRVHGGLGNQLFQYAFGRGAAARFKTDLILDAMSFSDPKYNPHKIHRPYSLAHFRIQGRIAKDSDMFGLVWLRKRHRAFERVYQRLRLRKRLFPFYYPERTFAYDPAVFAKNRSNTYFDGYWQTEKYFKHIADELRDELVPVQPLSAESEAIRGKIEGVNAVSLHVRRGDYITNPGANASLGVCSPEYYAAAIAHIEKRVFSPYFFIFSDDYEWSAEHFKFLKHPFMCIRGSEDRDYEDMHLMSRCKHHIIANSSFGWWGAWLNPGKEKIVIAPKQWFANAPKADTRDILPEEWIRF